MSKILAILFILLTTIFPNSYFLPQVSASTNCSSIGITYEPTAFAPDPPNITLNFKVTNPQTLDNLMSNNALVRLHFGSLGPLFNDTSNELKVTGDTFSLTVTAIAQRNPGSHTPVLDWKPDSANDFTEYCSGIVYTVGDPYVCTVDPTLPTKIPPNSRLTIKFAGRANTEYILFRGGTQLAIVTTTNDGQGSFDNVLITGVAGDSVGLNIEYTIYTPGGGTSTVRACPIPSIKIDPTASPVGSPPPGPVQPPPPGTTPGGPPAKPIVPAVGGGQPCGNDKNNPGIITAIGCIHTSPVGFIKDSLKFILGIAGGLAFLMMLLGAFQMLNSAGNPETLNAGKDRLSSAVIGLLIVIFSVLLLQIIGVDILGLPGFKEPI